MASKRRYCVACGEDQSGRRVWEQWTSGPHKGKTICMACGGEWTMDADAQPKRRQRRVA